MLNLTKIKIDRVGAASLPGYSRGAWFTAKKYGVEVKNINTRLNACFIVHQSKTDKSDVLVELKFLGEFKDISRPEVMSISPEIIRDFVKNMQYEQFVVERDGHVFIKGLANPIFESKRPSEKLCLYTIAVKFMETMGIELATATVLHDKIHNYAEAVEVNVMLNRISRFVNEMEECGVINAQKEQALRNLNYNRNHLENVERNMNECHEKNRESKETLMAFGIDPDKYNKL